MIKRLAKWIVRKELDQLVTRMLRESSDMFNAGWDHGFDYVIEYHAEKAVLPSDKLPNSRALCLLDYLQAQESAVSQSATGEVEGEQHGK